MKTKPIPFLLAIFLIGMAGFALPLQASVRLSGTLGYNQFENRVRFQTVGGIGLPDGDWTVGIWDNNFQGNGGWILNAGSPTGTTSALNFCYDKARGRYSVGGFDSAGNAFGSAGTVSGINLMGAAPGGYSARITGKFSPRLHIIRRRAGFNEYLVAEAGHAPVLVSSQQRPFVGFPAKGWYLACHSDWAELYDGDLEGYFVAPTAVSDQEIALMAAGQKPTSIPSLNGNLPIYFPLETAILSNTANPFTLTNQGSDSAIGLKRMGPVGRFFDGPMLRGATSESDTPAQVVEPTNVVALKSFQPFQIIRHLNGSAHVQFTGFDCGVGTADIEIRFLHVEQGTSTPWQTLLAGSTGGGVAIDATVPVPKGYWKTMEVRRVNSSGGTGNSSRPNRTWSRWAVGEVVVVWGDSIQGQVETTGRANLVAPNGFTAKYPSNYPNTISGDTNPLNYNMWNFLRGSGMGGGSQGENEIANKLSEASQCCVGITVVWAGATRLAYWNGRLGSSSYNTAKAFCMANGGLNKPNVITWVANLASAKYGDDFYQDLELFKNVLNADFGEGTWRLVVAGTPIIYDPEPVSGGSLHKIRDETWRWTRDNPLCASFGGISLDHLTYDGVHPSGPAWDLMGPRWGNAVAFLRAPQIYADPRGGEIVKFFRSSGSLIAQVQLYAGSALSLKNPAANISGFTLSSDNFATTIPISSAVLINGTTIRITPASLPAGPLKLRYQFGRPGVSGTTPAQMGTDNMLYVNAGPTNIVAIQPIYGSSSSSWALEEGTAPPPPSITPGTLPTGKVGGVYNQSLAATGGASPYTWSLVSGTLPSGLILGSDGVITGTPSSSGTAGFAIQAAGSDGMSSTADFSLTIVSPYAAWLGDRFTPVEISSGLATMMGDVDCDGIPNVLEYALGGNPKLPDATLIAAVSGLGGNQFQISFPCDANCTDVTYTVQASATLDSSSWTDIARSIGGATTLPIGSLSSVSDPGAGRRSVTVTDSAQMSALSKKFLRVQVAVPSP